MIAKKESDGAPPRRRGLPWLRMGLVLLALNGLIQLSRKPGELLAALRSGREKSPEQTWQAYGPAFRRHATPVITADFLAALAQVESAGDPSARPRWVWRLTLNPLRAYGPPSSALGLMQMTDGNFAQARGLRYKDGKIVRSAGFYSRVSGADSIQMTAAFLHLHVQRLLGARASKTPLRDKQRLAAVIHLCGPERGPALIAARFNPDALGRCGEQPVGSYVRLVLRYRLQFARRLEPLTRPA